MAEPTLQQVFGVNSTQTATTLTISKADLAAVGLSASATNTAESLFVGIMLLAASYLTEANQQTNPDIQVTLVDSFQTLTTRNNQQYRQKTYSLNLQKLDASLGVDPDDY